MYESSPSFAKNNNRAYRQDRLDNSQVVLGYDWPKKRKLFSARSLTFFTEEEEPDHFSDNQSDSHQDQAGEQGEDQACPSADAIANG